MNDVKVGLRRVPAFDSSLRVGSGLTSENERPREGRRGSETRCVCVLRVLLLVVQRQGKT
jgi:hypothetical protein